MAEKNPCHTVLGSRDSEGEQNNVNAPTEGIGTVYVVGFCFLEFFHYIFNKN